MFIQRFPKRRSTATFQKFLNILFPEKRGIVPHTTVQQFMKCGTTSVALRGFTLTELITVVAIVGISMGIFYGVFLLNWEAFDSYVARADLSQELDTLIDEVADDGRFAKQIDVISSPTSKQAVFIDPDGNVLGTYSINDTGEFVIQRGPDSYTISTKIDFGNSNFDKHGKSVLLTLALTDQIFGKQVSLSSATEIYPRN